MKKVLVLSLTAMLAAGCSDGTAAPRSPSASLDSTIPGGGSNATLTSTDTIRFSFVIDPRKDITYNLGAGNTLYFPARSLCDPATSTYGSGQWDAPCDVAKSTVTINTKAWLDKQGLAHLDFDKHVRFVPTANAAGWVMLSLSSYDVARKWLNIKYCADLSKGGCVDEAATDPTLATVKDPITGRYTRRVKHFSGYSLTSGRDDYSM